MKAVILAGGLGTRIREETEFRPKPMVEIGGKPIIWHIMKNLSVQGINDFVICLGYKGEVIKDFFLNYHARTNDVYVNTSQTNQFRSHSSTSDDNWNITLADTGLNTQTGGRIKRVSKYLGEEPFLCTYGDGVADINLKELQDFHFSHGKIATVTSVNPPSRFGALTISNNGEVLEFVEKPGDTHWINGGFFIFNSPIFSYLSEDSVLEQEPLRNLVSDSELRAYKHSGFWRPMDTYRESKELNELYEGNKAPWRNWN
jgi:glucose-1-phosphate cytidylyltransferase